MEELKRLGASVTVLFALLAGPTQAAPFDEKLKPPRAATAQALRTKLEAHFATFQRKQQDPDPAAFIRDAKAYRQWSDLDFALQLAMDERTPLKDLDAFGVVARPDGTYHVDLHAFPQWEPLDSRLHRLTNQEILESYLPALKARGFRDEDLTALQTYVATHDPKVDLHTQGRQLVDTFAKRLQAQRKVGQRLNLQEVLAYRYQKTSLRTEAERRWAVGLMDALDRQRQRILVSFLDEFQAEMVFGASQDDLAATLEQEAQPILSGEYVQILTTEEAQLRRDMERRTEKLSGGEQR
ncbi:MAG TPA: hypothetical protein VN705_15365 [Steroidobacteraceae bacterium]|jgi:hypothetical protein|nr:hypothetical protein [Steroidobacteraceae bacterium]